MNWKPFCDMMRLERKSIRLGYGSMLKTQMMEMLIAADDHRVLSAHADAWQLVDNSNFLPVEQFLTEESQAVFSARFSERYDGWFPVMFKAAPQRPCLVRMEGESGGDGSAPGIVRMMAIPADQILPDYLRLAERADAMDAMLSLSEDVYFEYDPVSDAVTLMNTTQSDFSDGARPFDAFAGELRSRCGGSEISLLNGFLSRLKGCAPHFLIELPCNLFNQDPSIPSTILRGILTTHGGSRRVVGLIHPQRVRGTGDRLQAVDPLTNLYNKEQIARMAADRVDQLHAEDTAIAIVDVDFFKHVNDTYGHRFGDQVLRQTADIMKSVVGNSGVIGRIGGDEFFILFYHVTLEELRACLRSIKSVVNATFPDKGAMPDSPITVSVGAAIYPKDARNYEDLFMLADYCLYLAKEKGRNRYIHYTTEKHPPLEEIRKMQASGERNLVNGRDDLPLGDVITQLQFLVRYGSVRPPIASVLADFADRFRIPMIMLWTGKDPARLTLTVGEQREEAEQAREPVGAALNGEMPASPQPSFHGITVFNRITRLSGEYAAIRDALLEKDVQSLVFIPFTDRDGQEACLVFAALHRSIFWNEQHLPYYRLFVDTLTQYSLAGDAAEGQ